MALFNNTYSGLITKGLGMPACCGLITMGFGVFFCKVEIIQPPPGNGGGGGYVTSPGVYVPWPKKITSSTKMVLITVKFSEDKTWRRSYVVDSVKAAIIVRSVNLINAAVSRMSVGVEAIKQASKRVVARFRQD